VHYVIDSPGVGKTFLAKLIAWRACQANQRVLFTTAMDMLNHLLASQVDHSLVESSKPTPSLHSSSAMSWGTSLSTSRPPTSFIR